MSDKTHALLQQAWLLIPPLALCVTDFSLTLYGQSDAYWAGDYSQPNEMSPSFATYLAMHPIVVIGAGFLWVSIFSAFILLAPRTLALGVSIAVVLGHLMGAESWLVWHFGNYQACNALCLATAAAMTLVYKNAYSAPESMSLGDKMPAYLRWPILLALLILPIWWFLIPR